MTVVLHSARTGSSLSSSGVACTSLKAGRRVACQAGTGPLIQSSAPSSRTPSASRPLRSSATAARLSLATSAETVLIPVARASASSAAASADPMPRPR